MRDRKFQFSIVECKEQWETRYEIECTDTPLSTQLKQQKEKKTGLLTKTKQKAKQKTTKTRIQHGTINKLDKYSFIHS